MDKEPRLPQRQQSIFTMTQIFCDSGNIGNRQRAILLNCVPRILLLQLAYTRMEAINILVQSLYFIQEESEGKEKINDSLRLIFN